MGTRRQGSRVLLAVSLAGGILGAFAAGGIAAEWLLDLLGISLPAVRLALKAAVVVAALPAGFYAVERAFLVISERKARGDA